MSVVAELDANLQALRDLKPPGVTKSRIAAITTLCIENVASESVLVQKIFTQFKRTPATHKLGVLYVVDSVTRQWVDKARSAGQELATSSVQDGTFAAGVQRVTELLPMLMNDLIQSAPADQLEKVGKLIDIWERGNTFPTAMLSGFKAKVSTRQKAESSSNTPMEHPSSRPTSVAPAAQPPEAQPAAAQQPAPASLPPPITGIPGWPLQSAQSNNIPASAAPSWPPPTNNVPLAPLAGPAALTSPQDALAQALQTAIPLHIQQDPVAMQKQVQTLQQLAAMNVPQDQWPIVLAALNAQQAPALPVATPQNVPGYAQPQNPALYPTTTQQISGYRERSRSPTRRRDSPQYGTYGQGANAYRQRSPVPDRSPVIQSGPTKWLEFDATLLPGNIKVLSRTLFVGGVTCGEAEIREIFARFGKVQTVIAQTEKRHAFVKMCTRADAVNAKDQMSNMRDPDVTQRVRSTRWGVGFGPRDCSDYTTGISIVPIDRLTEADKKWVVTAEYGGTGGTPLKAGQVMEEPDIEIGAGVSSKAISRRLPPHDSSRNDFRNENRRGGSNHKDSNNPNNDPLGSQHSPQQQQQQQQQQQFQTPPQQQPQYGTTNNGSVPGAANLFGMAGFGYGLAGNNGAMGGGAGMR